jgi:hypothetical protein
MCQNEAMLSDTQFLVCDVTILPSTLMPGLMCNDLSQRASIRVRPANVRMQFNILAKTTNCSPQEKLFPTFIQPIIQPTKCDVLYDLRGVS